MAKHMVVVPIEMVKSLMHQQVEITGKKITKTKKARSGNVNPDYKKIIVSNTNREFNMRNQKSKNKERRDLDDNDKSQRLVFDRDDASIIRQHIERNSDGDVDHHSVHQDDSNDVGNNHSVQMSQSGNELKGSKQLVALKRNLSKDPAISRDGGVIKAGQKIKGSSVNEILEFATRDGVMYGEKEPPGLHEIVDIIVKNGLSSRFFNTNFKRLLRNRRDKTRTKWTPL